MFLLKSYDISLFFKREERKEIKDENWENTRLLDALTEVQRDSGLGGFASIT